MAAPPKPAGYFFQATPDGQFAIESDQPYPGCTTLTWKPLGGYPGTAVEIVLPQDLFAKIAIEYATHLAPVAAQRR